MSHETPTVENPSDERHSAAANYKDSILDTIAELPHIDASDAHGLPLIELRDDPNRNGDVPTVVLIRKKHVDYVGTSVEAPKRVDRFDVPYYVIGHTDDGTSLLVAEPLVDAYKDTTKPQSQAEILTESHHREAMLPKPDTTPRIFTLETTGVKDRLRNMPSVRRKLATNVLLELSGGSTDSLQPLPELPLYSPSKLEEVGVIDSELAERYNLAEALERLQAAYDSE